MKTKMLTVSVTMRVGLPKYSSAEVQVARTVELGPDDKPTVVRRMLYDDALEFVQQETDRIIDSKTD